MNNDEIRNIVAAYISEKKLKKLTPEFNWGNLLGDYGELVSINHYGRYIDSHATMNYLKHANKRLVPILA